METALSSTIELPAPDNFSSTDAQDTALAASVSASDEVVPASAEEPATLSPAVGAEPVLQAPAPAAPPVQVIRVAIADDQMLFRKGMSAIVNGFEGVEMCLEASNGLALLDGLAKLEQLPQVALIDLSMPELNGVETTKQLRQLYPEMKVIVLSVYAEDRFVLHLMDLGINSYLVKNAEPEEVERAIRTVMTKDFYYNEAFREAITNRMKLKRPRRVITNEQATLLSSREVEVLNLICRQLTAQEIAAELNVSTRTVDGHRASLLEKTGARNTAGLVLYAIKNGLLDPGTLL